tara:strand:- start:2774 stop:3832 length:1059 start_codon:yes stop_codon:yes gene_type:complete
MRVIRGLNEGFLHISTRLDRANINYPSMSGLRLSAEHRMWLLNILEASSDTIKAWDRIPVSILRFTIATETYKELPDDAHFARASLNLTIASEACHYIQTTETDSLIVFGVPKKKFDWFNGLTLIERIKACDSPRFAIRLNINPKSLVKDNTAESAIYNTCLILNTELNGLSKGDYVSSNYDGFLSDYGTTAHEIHNQMIEMLTAEVRPAYVANATGLSLVEVSNASRGLTRKTKKPINKQRGRTPIVETSFARSPMQATLFMLIYTIVGKSIRGNANAKAALYSYRQLKSMLEFIGVPDSDQLQINECLNIMMGTISGELMWGKCDKCGLRVIMSPQRPPMCSCGKPVIKT